METGQENEVLALVVPRPCCVTGRGGGGTFLSFSGPERKPSQGRGQSWEVLLTWLLRPLAGQPPCAPALPWQGAGTQGSTR